MRCNSSHLSRPLFAMVVFLYHPATVACTPSGSRPSLLIAPLAQQGFWQQYNWTIILAIALLIIQSLLIAGLLLDRRRKKSLDPSQAEAARIKSDVSERTSAERELVQLTTRLFDIQDQERRRIARELHDGTAQNLFAISINLQKLSQLNSGNEEMQRLIAECQSLDEQSLKEIRTLSYLLHPPLLDQAGLVSALQWYVDGFTKRSGIFVKLFAEPIGRLQSDIEMALFRVVQEALSNVRRHSASETASIRLARRDREVVLQINDQGKGLTIAEYSPDTNGAVCPGVGIPGMKQRLRQLGGTLDITSNHGGTTVSVVVPIAKGVNNGTNTAR